MRTPTQHVTLLMTGGHITPAIATIEEIRSRFPTWRIVFVGRKRALEGNHIISEEYRLITGLKLPFVPIVAGRLKREGGIGRLVALLKVPVGLFQAMDIVRRERPRIIVSFGGYVALPVALAGKLFHIPIVTHEQTTRPGLANRIISRVASAVCVTFPDTATRFRDSKRVLVTGLPLRKAVLHPPWVCPFRLSTTKPILLVVGGSTGSVSINDVIFKSLPRILGDYALIHLVGRASEERSREAARTLPPQLKDLYVVKSYLSASEYSWALHHAKIVIGRSGANTVMELMLSAAIALCIPLPWSAGNEQLHNARYLLPGGSVILPQDALSPATLLRTIKSVMANWDERKKQALRLSSTVPKNGAQAFVDVIERVVATS